MLRYVHRIENKTCMVVSNFLPFHKVGEYPKNWKNNLVVQKMPSPKEILLPKAVDVSSVADVRQRRPIRNTAKAIKNAWTYSICLFIRLTECNSVFHLKYFGKAIWTNANSINSNPIILRCSSIFVKDESSNKWRNFYFVPDCQSWAIKCFKPGVFGMKM